MRGQREFSSLVNFNMLEVVWLAWPRNRGRWGCRRLADLVEISFDFTLSHLILPFIKSLPILLPTGNFYV